MSATKWPWFERHFNLDFPESKLPDIIERLRGTVFRLPIVQAIPEADRIRRLGRTWSIQENVGHLLTLEPLWLGRLQDISNGALTMREADLENQATFDANFNQVPLGDLISRFSELRQQLVRDLERPIEFLNKTSLHPRMNIPMRAVDLAYFVAEHDDYHFARIAEINRLIVAG